MPRRFLIWIRLAIVITVIAMAFYARWRDQAPLEEPRQPPAVDVVVPSDAPPVATEREATDNKPQARTTDLDATGSRAPGIRTTLGTRVIRDQRGAVVFRGKVDVAPTLLRIERDDRLSFRNDGSTFENRERRLPVQKRGYYHEYVHPTPELSGPGPQRLVLGAGGEIYYTQDHYRTFERIDAQRGRAPPSAP